MYMQVGERIREMAEACEYFKMQMRCGGIAGGPNDTDPLAGVDPLVIMNQDFFQVSRAGPGIIRMHDYHHQTIAAVTPSHFNYAFTRGNNSISAASAFFQIYAIMIFSST